MVCQMGVLLSDRRYRRLVAGDHDVWRHMALAQEKQFGVKTLMVPVCDVDLDGGKVRAAVATPLGWTETLAEQPPRVYYNLMVLSPKPESRALRALNGDLRVVVFNETNRWNRGLVFDVLSRFPHLKDHVPATFPYNPDDPELMSAGQHIFLLAQTQRPLRWGSFLLAWKDRTTLQYTKLPDGLTGTWNRSAHAERLRSTIPRSIRWVSRLNAMPVGPDGPAEWRLYAHRNALGRWVLDGALAKRDLLRTGAEPERWWPFEEAFQLTFGAEGIRLADQLRSLALEMTDTLNLFLPGVVHCAMDFWVDHEGRFMLADLAGRYRIDWLRRLGDEVALQHVLNHPVQFARTLEETGVGKLDVGFGRAGSLTRSRCAPALPAEDGEH